MPHRALLVDERTHLRGLGRLHRGRGFAEERGIDLLGEAGLAGVVEVDAVDGERAVPAARGFLEQALRRVEQVDEGHARDVTRGLGHRARVGGEVLVYLRLVLEIRVGVLFHRGRREQDDARGREAVVRAGAGLAQERGELLAELRQPVGSGEGLVVAEEREHDARLHLAEPLVGRAEILRARAVRDLVAGECEIAHGDVVRGVLQVDHGFHPAVVLHPVGEGVAHDRDAVPRVELEGRLGCRGGGNRGRGGGAGCPAGRGLLGGLLRGRVFRRRGGRRGARGRFLAERVVRGRQPVAVAFEPVRLWGEWIDEAHVRRGRHVEAKAPENRVHHDAARSLADQVGRGAEGGREDAVFLAGLVAEHAGPGDRHRGRIHALGLFVGRAGFRLFRRHIRRAHAFEHQTAHENARVGRRVGLVDVAVAEDILHPAQDRVGGVGRLGYAAGGLELVASPVRDPGLAEDVFAEAARPGRAAVPAVLSVR